MIHGQLNSLRFPNLLAFAKDRTVSLQKFLKANDPLSNFNLPMTRQAHNEFLLLLDSALEMRSE